MIELRHYIVCAKLRGKTGHVGVQNNIIEFKTKKRKATLFVGKCAQVKRKVAQKKPSELGKFQH